MFLKEEERRQGEQFRESRPLKLSEAIRLGIKVVPEGEDYCGCALGAAYTYMTGKNLQIEQDKSKYKGSGFAVVADMFGVPHDIAYHASTRHLLGDWTREKCADYFERLGY